MKARLVKFGEIEVEGKRYTHDVVIDGGKVRKRKKGPSKRPRCAGRDLSLPFLEKRILFFPAAPLPEVMP